MTSAGLLISLPQMVELAIGSPEVGAVNFNLLAAALQVIIQQLKLDSYTVDFRGPDVERMQGLLATTKPGISLKISEAVNMDSSTILVKEEAISTTEQRRIFREETNAGGIRKSGKVIVVEPSNKRRISALPHVVVGVSQELFVQINNDVEELKGRMQEMLQLANNDTLIKAVRAQSQDKVTPVKDMWQALSIAKRLESTETGMEKLAGMFENLVQEIGGIGLEGTGKVLTDIAERIQAIEQKVIRFEAGGSDNRRVSAGVGGGSVRVSAGGSAGGPRVPAGSGGGRPVSTGGPQAIAAGVPRASAGGAATEGAGGPPVPQAGGAGFRASAGYDPEEPAEKEDKEDFDPAFIEEIAVDVEELKTKLGSMEEDFNKIMKGAKGKNFGDLFRDVDEIKKKLPSDEEEGEEEAKAKTGIDETVMYEIQEKFAEITSKLENLDETYSLQLAQLQEQLLNIEKELGVIIEANNTKEDSPTDVQSIGDLYTKIVKLQEGIDILTKSVEKINEDQEERTLNMIALTEQIELMKTTKADREDLEDALAEKADTQQVNRKVSTMQFDAACEGLTRHIEDTMKKLAEQEEMWQATLVEIQMTIGSKLDKQEFDPLKDFVNKKIRSLQQRLKALLAMKQEQEAAGTKSKILKNVNCISCDKDVIMFKENKFSTLPQPSALPGNRSIKPYITYELDAVRKQQKSLPPGRNMNHLESALQDTKKDKPIEKVLPAGHLCNRYCGGSHTMTQPQQRVAHIGHFLNQWGPQAIPLDEGSIMGTDGNVYKARDEAQVQTADTKERVPRMSSGLESAKRSAKKNSNTPRGSRKSQSSMKDKKPTSPADEPAGTTEAPATEEAAKS